MAMYSYLPKVPFNDVAKDVLHPPEQPLCTSLEHPIAPYIVHADSDVVRDHAVQGKQRTMLKHSSAPAGP